MSLILSYQLTEDDYFEFSYFTAWKASWNKKKRIIYFAKVSFFAFLGSTVLLYSLKKDFPKNLIVTIFVFLVLYISLLSLLIKDNYRRLARKIYNDPKNSNLFSVAELSFDENGIRAKDNFSDNQHSWSAITKISETPKHHFLYLSEITALIIPKRVFKSKEDEDKLKILMNRNIHLRAQLENLEQGTN